MMATMTKARKAEQDAARAELATMFPHGSTANLILRHCSASGMSRSISVLTSDLRDVSGLVAVALDWPRDHKRGGVKVTGCGMDMGFHLVYSMAYVVHKDNPARADRDAGYSIDSRWL